MAASDGISLSLVGDKKLQKLLDTLPAKFSKKAIRKGTREGTKIVTKAAKSNAPKGETGALRKGIKTKAMKAKRGYIGTTTQLSDKNFRTFYGPMTEYGTQFQKAQGFLKKASEDKGEQATQKAAEIMKAELIKIATTGPK